MPFTGRVRCCTLLRQSPLQGHERTAPKYTLGRKALVPDTTVSRNLVVHHVRHTVKGHACLRAAFPRWLLTSLGLLFAVIWVFRGSIGDVRFFCCLHEACKGSQTLPLSDSNVEITKKRYIL